ncbi:MAG: autotransporter-associated beta strand repeat-containing protein [Verrucomicrobia bacterium]|nr:autotransporter-associated beta strand repeat-containing protein [Verrucomicrobiota bacterium]
MLGSHRVQAASAYWDNVGGTLNNWGSLANWSSVVGGGTDPASIPDAGTDIATFSATSVVTTQTVNLNAARRLQGLVFSSSSAHSLLGGDMDRTLMLGTSGIAVNSGAGTVTIGSATGGQNVAIIMVAAQSWTNNSANTLTIVNNVTNGVYLLTVGGTGNTTIKGVIGTSAGGLTKTGSGTLTLASTAANTFTGNVALNSGTVVLDYTASDTEKLGADGQITLGGATVTLQGGTGANREDHLGTTLAAGASFINRNGGTAQLRMDVLTRNGGGTLDVSGSGVANIDNTNTNGILGAWATLNGTDWAINSTDSGDGGITALATYTDVTRLSSGTKIIPNTSTANIRIIQGTGSAANITLAATTTLINTLNQSASGGTSAAIIDPVGRTLRVGGILVGKGAGGLTLGTGTNNGTVTAAAAGGDLILHDYAGLTINSVIANNTNPSTLTKSGTGTTTLTGANTYTAQTYLNQGTLSISANYNLGLASSGATLHFDGGTLQATSTFGLYYSSAGTNNRAVTLADNGGTIAVTGSNNLTVAGVISGIGSLTKSDTGTLTLSGTNTYTGATKVSSGKLTINGSGTINSTSGVSIGAGEFNYNSANVLSQGVSFSGTGGTLSGTGTITPAVTVTSGNTYTPGEKYTPGGPSAAGTQTLTGGVTFSTASIFEWDIDVLTASTESHDRVTASALAGSGAEFKILLGTGDSYADQFWNANRDWTAANLFGSSNALANLANIFSSLNTSTNFNPSPLQGFFSFTSVAGGTNNNLSWTAVPEPTSTLAGLLLGAGLLRRRRN